MGIEVTAANLNELGEPTVTIDESNVSITGGTISGLSSPIAIADGGTNATSASSARSNLGLGTIATQASNSIAVTGGTMSGVLITLPSYAVSAVTNRRDRRTHCILYGRGQREQMLGRG